jgi:hypothetical protein
MSSPAAPFGSLLASSILFLEHWDLSARLTPECERRKPPPYDFGLYISTMYSYYSKPLGLKYVIYNVPFWALRLLSNSLGAPQNLSWDVSRQLQLLTHLCAIFLSFQCVYLQTKMTIALVDMVLKVLQEFVAKLRR